MESIEWRYITNRSAENVDINRYMISDKGSVWDTKANRYLNISIDESGYHRVHLHTSSGFKQFYIHRIVISEFVGIPAFIDINSVDHKDCDKSHNYPYNLEWVTGAENAKRAIDNNLYPQFDIKISATDARFICEKLKEGLSYKSISDLLYDKYKQNLVGIIGKIYRGERWKEVSKDYLPFPKLKKDLIIPKNSYLSELIVENICMLLDTGHGITETARIIESKYCIDADLENAVGMIKRGKSWKSISCKYNFIRKD